MQAAKSTGKAGGAPQPVEERWAEDGNKYTLQQFLEFYKEDVYKYWKAAPKVSGSAASHGGDVAHLAAPPYPCARHQPITTTGEEIITRAKVAENIFNLLSTAGKKQPFLFLTRGKRYEDLNILRYGIIGGRDLRQLSVASRTVHEWVGIIGIEWNKQAKEPCITVWGTA